MRLGAQTDLMDEAWWMPSPRTGRFGQSTLDQARQRPRTIYVDSDGRRFVNESNSYMEVGKAMYARDQTSKAIPCWLIFDDRYRKRYAHLRSSPGRFPKKLFESGRLKQAWTLDDLARLCDIDPDGLAPPEGVRVLGMSSDHLVVDLGDHGSMVGDELVFGIGYGGLLRAMTSPFVAVVELAAGGPRSIPLVRPSRTANWS